MSVLLGILYRNGGFTKRRRNYTILITLNTLVLLATPFIRVAQVGNDTDLISQQQYLKAGLLGFLVYDDFPIFPFAAYGLLGVVLGDLLTQTTQPTFRKNI